MSLTINRPGDSTIAAFIARGRYRRFRSLATAAEIRQRECANMSILDRFSLKGKTALISGGAGIYGRQIVRALAEAGATTFVASRDLQKLKELALALQNENLDVTALSLDQGEEGSIQNLLKELLSRAQKVDVL